MSSAAENDSYISAKDVDCMDISDSNEEENSVCEIKLDSINKEDLQGLEEDDAMPMTTPKKGTTPKKKATDADISALFQCTRRIRLTSHWSAAFTCP